MKTKLFLIGLISIVLCLCLTGCGTQENVVTQKDVEQQVNNLIDMLLSDDETENNTTAAVSTENNSTETVSKSNPLKLYSDDTKIVFLEDDTYMVFTYSGNEITGYTAYVLFDSAAEAQIALAEYNEDPDEDVKSIQANGSTVVLEYDESVYEGLTVDMIKLAYSYLEEVKK